MRAKEWYKKMPKSHLFFLLWTRQKCPFSSTKRQKIWFFSHATKCPLHSRNKKNRNVFFERKNKRSVQFFLLFICGHSRGAHHPFCGDGFFFIFFPSPVCSIKVAIRRDLRLIGFMKFASYMLLSWFLALNFCHTKKKGPNMVK